jgi:hypothetical protein
MIKLKKKSIKKRRKKPPKLTDQIRDPSHETMITLKKAK